MVQEGGSIVSTIEDSEEVICMQLRTVSAMPYGGGADGTVGFVVFSIGE